MPETPPLQSPYSLDATEDGRSRRHDPYEQLKEAIYVGDLVPGEHLVETALAKNFKVSRTPIREALTRLEQDGLLVRDRAGLHVRERSPGEVLDIYDVRILLEGWAGKVAAERRTNNDLLTLRQSMKRYESVTDEDIRMKVMANRRFHVAVWHASHQPALIDLVQRVELQLSRFPASTLAHPGRWEESCRQHGDIVRAIEARDSEAAMEACSEHFRSARDIRLTIWEESWEVDPAVQST